MARDYLAIAATSASSERCFSPARARLSYTKNRLGQNKSKNKCSWNLASYLLKTIRRTDHFSTTIHQDTKKCWSMKQTCEVCVKYYEPEWEQWEEMWVPSQHINLILPSLHSQCNRTSSNAVCQASTDHPRHRPPRSCLDAACQASTDTRSPSSSEAKHLAAPSAKRLSVAAEPYVVYIYIRVCVFSLSDFIIEYTIFYYFASLPCTCSLSLSPLLHPPSSSAFKLRASLLSSRTVNYIL